MIMKIKQYIRKCNDKELSEFLSSIYWTNKMCQVSCKCHTIEEDALAVCELLQEEIPDMILYVGNHLINTKTGEIL